MTEPAAQRRSPLEVWVSALPIATAVALTAAVIFVEGHMFLWGGLWISSFAVQDIINLAWPSAPVMLFSFVAAYFWSPKSWYILVDGMGKRRELNIWSDDKYRKARIAVRMVAVLFLPIAFMILVDAQKNPMSFGKFSARIAAFEVIVVCAAFLLTTTVNHNSHAVAITIFGSATMIVFIFCVGTLAGASAVFNANNTLVTYDHHRFCGKYLTATNHGLLMYNPAYSSVRLFKWEDIKSVERPVQCRLQARWKPPVRPKHT